MAAIFVLFGLLALMLSFLWIVGEALKKDLLVGMMVLLFFPIMSIYYTFAVDYKRCSTPFAAGVVGLTSVIIGKAIGL